LRSIKTTATTFIGIYQPRSWIKTTYAAYIQN